MFAWRPGFYSIDLIIKPYVNMVVDVLDPARLTNPANSTIRGTSYSARGEYLHLMQSKAPRTPPKSVKTLFPWTASDDTKRRVRLDPLIGISLLILIVIVDDSSHMWKMEEQDGVILVRESKNSQIWNVNLQPIQEVLAAVHTEFFRQVDHHHSTPGKGGEASAISPVTVYKEILRKELSHRIAENTCKPKAEEKVEMPVAPTPQVGMKLVDSNGIPFSLY
jgi:hypothetical protein